jgi:hypothetical protein
VAWLLADDQIAVLEAVVLDKNLVGSLFIESLVLFLPRSFF